MTHGRWRVMGGIPLDCPRTGRAAQWRSRPIAVDEMKHLRGIVRYWTRLAHRPSGYSLSRPTSGSAKPTVGVAVLRQNTTRTVRTLPVLLLMALSAGCGPRAHIPLRPIDLRGALSQTDSGAMLARSLAPVLYLQRDERFPLSRVVAVQHPFKPMIAYYLLWRDDVNGSWIPCTVPTDEEVIWVGYDKAGAPVDVWTYWHGTILHTPWPRSQVAINVQWGKHGSLPRGIVESSLPSPKTLNFFFAATRFLIPDQLLSRVMRGGPVLFPHSYKRYRDFSKVLPLSNRIDAIARTDDPSVLLQAVFGDYSRKPNWPGSR